MKTLLFLGTGASGGIPMIGCKCAVCTSADPHNKRFRTSAFLNIEGKKLLIDSGPDFRMQALRHQLDDIDGVVLTHSHFDHIAGLDELRTYYLLHRKPVPVLVSEFTLHDLKRRYDYLFHEKSRGMTLSAQLDFHVLQHERGEASFLEIPFRYMTYEQGGMKVNGFKFGPLAYVSDIRNYPETIFEDLEGTKILVLSALRDKPSPMHFTVDEAISFAKKVQAKRTYFTHISHELDVESANARFPKGMQLAHDGLIVDFTDE